MAARMEGELEGNVNEMEGNEPAEGDNEVGLPVVLQCKNCNSILGDSMAWVLANDDLKTVTLHSVTNAVITGKKMMTSTTEGTDLGSTYVHLLCKQCNEVVGRIYKTTSRQLDSLRDLYTFSVHQIMSYQVGSGDQTADVNVQDTLDLSTAKTLKASILKTQVMICALNNRILNIENSLEMREDDDGMNEDEDTRQSNYQEPYTALDEEYSSTHARSDYMASKNQSTGQQDKTASQQNDTSVAARDNSLVSTQNGRQFSTGKRTKELSTGSGTRGNKRSRFK